MDHQSQLQLFQLNTFNNIELFLHVLFDNLIAKSCSGHRSYNLRSLRRLLLRSSRGPLRRLLLRPSRGHLRRLLLRPSRGPLQRLLFRPSRGPFRRLLLRPSRGHIRRLLLRPPLGHLRRLLLTLMTVCQLPARTLLRLCNGRVPLSPVHQL